MVDIFASSLGDLAKNVPKNKRGSRDDIWHWFVEGIVGFSYLDARGYGY